MALSTEILTLPPAGPGTERRLTVLRFTGNQPGPKAYVQAAVHADEIPALLVAHHLREKLIALDTADKLKGEIILVPYANPIGLTQFLQGWHLGRYELDSGANFNRGYPDLFEPVAAAVAEQLGADAAANVALIREALRAALPRQRPLAENAALKHHLYALSCDADVVLDLHCDYEATMHLYIGTPLWPAAADLSACLQSPVNLLAEDSGGEAFDEANSRLWWRLATRFPQHPIPPACCAATVELRGDRDVSDVLAAQDADGLIAFLTGRGFIDGPLPSLPATPPEATQLEAVDSLNAEHPGVLVWSAALGDEVSKDQVIGHLVDPETGARHAVTARTSGIFFAARGHRWVRPGQWIAKIAGRENLDWRKAGALLSS
ncbi:MAG: M14 family metallopeptidase [Stagnimonas sp.]|nr:M14 family metallopeptidase [Stagnimonas sp.]